MELKVHDRTFDFAVAVVLFGAITVAAMKSTLESHFKLLRRSTSLEQARHWVHFLEWLIAAVEPGEFIGSRIDDERLQERVHYWASIQIDDDIRAKSTIAERLKNVGRILDICADDNVLPRIARPRMTANYNRLRTARPTVAEIARGGRKLDYAAILKEAVERGDGGEEANRYLQALEEEVSANGRRLTNVELMRAIADLNRHRLDMLREIASRRFIACRDAYDRAQALVVEGVPISQGLASQILAGERHASGTVTRFFLEPAPEEAKANFIRFVHDHCGGVLPRGGALQLIGAYRKALARFGGTREVNGFFGAHEDAVAAAADIYMCDTNANPSTAAYLPPDFESKSDRAGMVFVRSRKDRPVPKDIIEELPIKDPVHELSAVEALRDVKRMTNIYRTIAPELGQHLLLFRWFDKPSITTTVFLANRLEYLLRETQLADVPIRPSFIRPAGLLMIGLNSGGSVAAVAARGDHGFGVAVDYTARYPVRLIYEQQMRYFMGEMEHLATKGRWKSDSPAIPETSTRIGNGLTCLDPRAGVQDDVVEGEVCGHIDRCLGCWNSYFVAEVESVAEVILLRSHLAAEQSGWEATRSERWTQVWLPQLAFCDVVLEKLRRSRFARLVPQAEQLAASMTAQGYRLAPLF
jgi:hypothetical protein